MYLYAQICPLTLFLPNVHVILPLGCLGTAAHQALKHRALKSFVVLLFLWGIQALLNTKQERDEDNYGMDGSGGSWPFSQWIMGEEGILWRFLCYRSSVLQLF